MCRRVVGGEVRHHEEAGFEPPRRVRQREVLLVLLHRQDQALLRHGEERAVERAAVDDRPFDERSHLVQQRVGHDHRRPLGGPGERLQDGGAALRERGDHLALGLERRLVGVGARDREVGAAEEAVAVGAVSGGEAECGDRHDDVAVQRDQPVRRAHEGDVVEVAVAPRVAHDLRDRQLLEQGVERVLQPARERRTLRERAQVHVVGLAVRLHEHAVGAVRSVERRRGKVGAGEARHLLRERLRGLAVGAERHLGRHQLLGDLGIGRHCAHVRDRRSEPPWRRETRGRGACVEEAARGEPGGEALREGLAQSLQRLRRQLLGEELDGEGGGAHGHATTVRCSSASIGKPSASRDAT